MRPWVRFALLPVFVLVPLACGDDDSDGPEVEAAPETAGRVGGDTPASSSRTETTGADPELTEGLDPDQIPAGGPRCLLDRPGGGHFELMVHDGWLTVDTVDADGERFGTSTTDAAVVGAHFHSGGVSSPGDPDVASMLVVGEVGVETASVVGDLGRFEVTLSPCDGIHDLVVGVLDGFPVGSPSNFTVLGSDGSPVLVVEEFVHDGGSFGGASATA